MTNLWRQFITSGGIAIRRVFCWFVGSFVGVCVRSLVRIRRIPATGCNGGWATGGVAGGRRCTRLAQMAPYECFF